MPDPPPSEFDSQRYPTVEETAANNASVLYKRKKFFLLDLRKTAASLGYVLIAMVYLRDASMSSFLARTMLQHFLSDPFRPPLHILLGDDASREEARTYAKIVFIIFFNGMSVFFHLIGSSPSSGTLHGSLTVQFIGERASSKWVLVSLDLAVLASQLVFHAVTCGVDDSEILRSVSASVSDDGSVSVEAASNGYNGNVTLLTVDLWLHVRKLLLFRPSANTRLGHLGPNQLELMVVFDRDSAERLA